MAQKTGQPAVGTATTEEPEDVFEIVEADADGNILRQPEGQDADADPDDLPDDPDDDDDDAEPARTPDGDERLGHSEGDQEGDAAQAPNRRRNENRLKRKRKSRERQLQEGRIVELTNAVVDLQGRLEQTEGRTVQANLQALQTQLQQVDATLEEAKATWKACMGAADHDGAQEVIDAQFALRENRRMLEAQIQRAQRQGRPQAGANGQQPAQQRQRPPQVDPRVVGHAQAFADDNEWYDPTGSDARSRRVMRIDNNMLQQGFDPRSEEYWEELRERVQEAGIAPQSRQRTNGSQNNGAGDSDNSPRSQIRGPRMAAPSQSGGSTRPLGKNQVLITPERKEAMKAAGAWDDTKKRDRLLRYYAEEDKRAAAARR